MQTTGALSSTAFVSDLDLNRDPRSLIGGDLCSAFRIWFQLRWQVVAACVLISWCYYVWCQVVRGSLPTIACIVWYVCICMYAGIESTYVYMYA